MYGKAGHETRTPDLAGMGSGELRLCSDRLVEIPAPIESAIDVMSNSSGEPPNLAANETMLPVPQICDARPALRASALARE